jgi:hypothetical protein
MKIDRHDNLLVSNASSSVSSAHCDSRLMIKLGRYFGLKIHFMTYMNHDTHMDILG